MQTLSAHFRRFQRAKAHDLSEADGRLLFAQSIGGRHMLAFLASPEDRAGRAARGSKFVMWAEIMPADSAGLTHTHVELDADDEAHARDLAEAWIVNFGAVSTSYRRVHDDGRIDPRPIEILDWRHFADPSD